jgi:replicative DNA helicase
MGAGKWMAEYTETLRGSTVHIIQDKDAPGRAHGRMVDELLTAADCTVSRYEAGREGAKDVSDHLAKGGTLDDLLHVSQDPDEVESPVGGTDILDYVQWDFAAERFVIPGTLAEEERALITGLEGHGKSTLFRQVAVMCSAGIHPFTLEEMDPVRTLVIDAENGPRQMHRSWSDLVGRAAHFKRPVKAGMLNLMMEYLNQPDLTSLEGREWLMERVNAYRPKLILLGPIQNLTGRDVKDDDVVRRLKRTIDESREVCGSAIFMEHHSPHRAPGDKKRSLRPYGSSLFLKWPDYGYGMDPVEGEEGVYEWTRTRYPRERSRVWPERLRWGKKDSVEWPWMDAGEDLRGSQNVRSA